MNTTRQQICYIFILKCFFLHTINIDAALYVLEWLHLRELPIHESYRIQQNRGKHMKR